MRAAGRGERARVAARVRAVLAETDPDEVDAVSGTPRPSPPSPPSLPLPERLAARRPVRLDPGRRGAVAVGVAALVAAVLTGWWVWSARPSTVPSGDPTGSAVSSVASIAALGGSSSPAPSSSAAAPRVVVDVVGKVHHPGLYRLPPGARIADAIDAAGGARPGVDLTRLNLAARVTDGQQVAVGVTGAAPGAAVGSSGAGDGTGDATGSPGAPVDLNTATLDQLETLPGVGPVLGQHILDWRSAHGSFTSVAQLDDVPGIGPAKFGELKDLVTV